MKEYENEFIAFILTHGRPDKVHTYKTLKKQGYTGPICLIVDNEDKAIDQYKKNFDHVEIFDKLAISKTFDTADNFDNRKTIVYARNACFDIAKKLGYKYFIQLDDDYTSINWKFNYEYEFDNKIIININKIFKILLKFYMKTPIASIALAQGGDYIGGPRAHICFGKGKIGMKRKCMNSFICSTERPFKFIGRINEDVNTYTHLGSKGLIFFTINYVALNQLQTQSNSGGMTETYLNSGTYIKSFYSLIFQPSSVKIGKMGISHRRYHHKVNWKATVPQIIRENIKKQKVKPPFKNKSPMKINR